MKWNELKYFLAYIAPASAIFGIWQGGHWSPAAVYVAFIIIPLLELISPKSAANHSPVSELNLSKNRFFDVLLYLNVPLLYGIIVYFAYTFLTRPLSLFEVIGMSAGIGVVVGAQINVAHELGHKHESLPKWLAKMILIPAFYNHFTIEHNLGHHKHIGTPEDPATSRYNENLYAFWVRCISGTYQNAWKLQKGLLKTAKVGFFSFQNELFWAHIIQAIYLLGMYLIGGLPLLACAVSFGVVGILLLESVNYIEHYGLMRKMLPSGRYERVETYHSWNANHEVGRIFLYELTRHADHHYKSTRPYQILRHWDESPQLPYGYPLSILMALVPPLWFHVMNERVDLIQKAS